MKKPKDKYVIPSSQKRMDDLMISQKHVVSTVGLSSHRIKLIVLSICKN